MNVEKLFSGMPVLESERIILKEIGKDSLDEVFDIYDNDRVFQYCGIIPKHNRQTVENMIGHFHRDYVKRKNMKMGIYKKSDIGGMNGN